MKKILSKNTLVQLNLHKELTITQLPTKVLQFGTGVLLRGLIDDVIHQANMQDIFNGRVAIIKSTDGNPSENQSFAVQDGLFTKGVRGIEDGKVVQYDYINSSISGVYSAKSQWASIKQIAISEDLEIIISNTTESGLKYIEEKLTDECPSSYTGKLCTLLYERFLHQKAGLVIIPTELLSNNGEIVKNNLLQLIDYNDLGSAFKTWVIEKNHFCSSLVDRIVPGRPDSQAALEWDEQLPYHDDLKFISEPFGLWAIQGDEKIKKVCSFYLCNDEVKIVEDITIYKELKLRLLNATHTALTAYALLNGYQTVYEAMSNENFKKYAEELMEEIAIGIPYEIDEDSKVAFAKSVIDRFSNPFIKHFWKDIAFNYTNKIAIRMVPVITTFVNKTGKLPEKLINGIGCYLKLYSQAVLSNEDYTISLPDNTFKLNDEYTQLVISKINEGPKGLTSLFENEQIWGVKLAGIDGLVGSFEESIK